METSSIQQDPPQSTDIRLPEMLSSQVGDIPAACAESQPTQTLANGRSFRCPGRVESQPFPAKFMLNEGTFPLPNCFEIKSGPKGK